jgi:hypothetical protein
VERRVRDVKDVREVMLCGLYFDDYDILLCALTP